MWAKFIHISIETAHLTFSRMFNYLYIKNCGLLLHLVQQHNSHRNSFEKITQQKYIVIEVWLFFSHKSLLVSLSSSYIIYKKIDISSTMVSIAGTYQYESQENFENILESMGRFISLNRNMILILCLMLESCFCNRRWKYF